MANPSSPSRSSCIFRQSLDLVWQLLEQTYEKAAKRVPLTAFAEMGKSTGLHNPKLCTTLIYRRSCVAKGFRYCSLLRDADIRVCNRMTATSFVTPRGAGNTHNVLNCQPLCTPGNAVQLYNPAIILYSLWYNSIFYQTIHLLTYLTAAAAAVQG